MEEGSGAWLPQDHSYDRSACPLVADSNTPNDEAVYLPNEYGSSGKAKKRGKNLGKKSKKKSGQVVPFPPRSSVPLARVS